MPEVWESILKRSIPTLRADFLCFTSRLLMSLNTESELGQPTPAAGNAVPGSHSLQGSGNVAPASHPILVGHPVQGPGNTPASHPVQRPQPPHQPPKEPGRQEHHKHHRHHDHRTQHEPHRAARLTRVAGGSSIKTIVLVLTTVVVVAAAGGIAAAAHFFSRPQSSTGNSSSQPLISITSNYKVGNAPAGATGTILYISGQHFASNSTITFLLDGQVAPGNPGTRSDSNGTFSSHVTITDAWSVGTHSLTARDASSHSTQKGVSVTIVQPGQANTSGPNGAPPDDASFRLKVTIGYQVADPFSQNPVLIITGHPDPEGGTVCSPYDSGKSFTFNETAFEGTLLIKTLTATCSGTYKAGQVSYIETTTSVTQHWQGNDTCVRNTPTIDLRLMGAYVGNNIFKGTLSSPYFTYTCNQGGNTYHKASQGVRWTGTVLTQ